eukprot:2476793-Alexandrium_andersonii.AAC.1
MCIRDSCSPERATIRPRPLQLALPARTRGASSGGPRGRGPTLYPGGHLGSGVAQGTAGSAGT